VNSTRAIMPTASALTTLARWLGRLTKSYRRVRDYEENWIFTQRPRSGRPKFYVNTNSLAKMAGHPGVWYFDKTVEVWERFVPAKNCFHWETDGGAAAQGKQHVPSHYVTVSAKRRP